MGDDDLTIGTWSDRPGTSVSLKEVFAGVVPASTFSGQEGDGEHSEVHWVSVFSDKDRRVVSEAEAISLEETKTGPQLRQRFLTLYASGQIKNKHLLSEGIFIAGRGTKSDIVIEDAVASRRHFVLEVARNQVLLADSGSGNGTKVNGAFVTKCVLKDGDQIEVGKTSLIFHFGESSPICFPRSSESAQPLGFIHGLANSSHVNQSVRLMVNPVRAKLRPIASLPVRERVVRIGSNKSKITRPLMLATLSLAIFATCVIGLSFFWQRIEQRQSIALASLREVMEHAMRVAALGDVEEARVLQNAAQELLEADLGVAAKSAAHSHFFYAMEGLREADVQAESGEFERAIQNIEEIDLSKLSREEAALAQKAMESRRRMWASALLRKATASPVQERPSVDVSEQWKNAVSLYKMGKRQDSCLAVREIVALESPGNAIAKKARSFLERRCETIF